MKAVSITDDCCYLDDCYSCMYPNSQDSQLSSGSDDSVGSIIDPADTAEKGYAIWDATRAAFDAWADDRTRRLCRWRCCRCRHVNRMPRHPWTMMHCRNPGHLGKSSGEGVARRRTRSCPRDENGETHMGPGGCCVILVPHGGGIVVEKGE
ncbi:hypothetical protein LZ32DRAFT_656341 [Colletotrichum eremochloae]|nr:hypothetical protein LZ32DRAFT_656341 [Colletotrichum eremochloae]